MSIYFTSDLHFSHCNILRFNAATRPFQSVDEMNQHIIAQWQSVVQPDDEVWVLGDVFWCSSGQALKIMDQLPGQIHLVLGNHDQVIRNHRPLQQRFASIQEYRELKIGGVPFVLFHFPVAEYNRMHYGAVHVHGHTHGNFTHPGRAVDVGWDGPLGQQMVSVDAIMAYTNPRPILTHHGNGLVGEQIIGKEKG